ncbi:MAG: hypothetical protein AAF329_28285 [Cyanobacteria bacterium P01_A01_bin.17]
MAVVLGSTYRHYHQTDISNVPLETETVDGYSYVGQAIQFEQVRDDIYHISFNLEHGQSQTELTLNNVDLSLMIPKVPERARGNKDLIRWFLSEREFNRQRVTFAAGSSHVDLPDGLGGYGPEQISVSLTNNCLGAGHWELAVSAVDENDQSQKIYQGYFDFPKGAYASLIAQANATSYMGQARTMEAWPGFRFLSGLPFDLASLRQVDEEHSVIATDLATEPVIAAKEQVEKAELMVAQSPEVPVTWADLRASEITYQSFVPPGIYLPERAWGSDYSQIAHLQGAVVRDITLPKSSQTAAESLVELELSFQNEAGQMRRWLISGIDLESLPQLSPQEYSYGFYRPLGFGPSFTEDYESLKQMPPSEDPYFSVLLDEAGQVINYRQDIGLNGLVMHRNLTDPNVIHLYPMSYERITLVGHYVIDLGDRDQNSHYAFNTLETTAREAATAQ